MTSARWLSALVMITLLGVARASGPSADEAQWNKTVLTLVDVIAGRQKSEVLAGIASPGAFIAPFDMNRTESISVLVDHLPTSNVVSARSYLHPSVSSASDIVSDLTANGTIDPALMSRLVPEDPSDLRRADATMARWFATALGASVGDPVAVVVLYDDGSGDAKAKPTLTFMLLRGEMDSAGNAQLTRVLYGPMQSAVK